MIRPRKKLIEVALPLEAINVASAREKSIRHGHPSTLHLWWARRPLAAARAVIFSQMVDDPSEYVDVLRADPKLVRKAEGILKGKLKLWEEARSLAGKAREAKLPVTEPGPKPTLDEVLADQERQRLFRIIEDLVLWENTTNETVLQAAREEIWQSWRRTCAENAGHPRAKELFDRNKLPAFHDPFAGGGALPLEAQRLGLEAYASDLNPVAVLINKAMIEIPPKFANRPPVHPVPKDKAPEFLAREWKGAQGLAEDVRYYGQWMRDEAEKRIGHLYPKVEITKEMAKERPDLKKYVGQELTVIAWLWARTVKSPNPAFREVDVPLTSTFVLATKAGREAYIEPVIDGASYSLLVRAGAPPQDGHTALGTKLTGSNFRCLLSGTVIEAEYIREEARARGLGARLLAVIAEGDRGQVYLSPNPDMEELARKARPHWKPDLAVPTPCHDVDRLPMYGMPTWGDAFEPRQLVALTTFADLVAEARERVFADAIGNATSSRLRLGAFESATDAYADAIAVYLGLAVGRSANYWSSFTPWAGNFLVQTFGRQAIRMVWDHAEGNPFSDSTGNWTGALEWIAKVMELALPALVQGHALQGDANAQALSSDKVVSTDPPYYDNISYADLADFFYVWLRPALRALMPELFATISTPKAEELVATPTRHGGKANAETFFLQGMSRVLQRLAEDSHPAFPVSIYYAFKQAETSHAGTVSSGWETFLSAVVASGFSLTGTWPMRTEREQGLKSGTNVLASSIILVCRRRAAAAPTATLREFVTALKAELPGALAHLQRGNIAPVDLAQAAIGPGMAVYTRYAKVLDAEGKPLSVREALALINQTLDEALAEQEGDFDADSRWALTWFEQSGFEEGEYGVAEQLSKSKNTSVAGLEEAGILVSKRGKVRLLRPEELPKAWDPAKDERLTAWETVHHLIRVLGSGGESAAAALVAKLGAKAETARELCYRLYTLCERKKRAQEALAYNGLVQSWPEIMRLAQEGGRPKVEQTDVFGDGE